MKYRDAMKLRPDDEVMLKKSGEIVRVNWIELIEVKNAAKIVKIVDCSGNIWYHTEVK